MKKGLGSDQRERAGVMDETFKEMNHGVYV